MSRVKRVAAALSAAGCIAVANVYAAPVSYSGGTYTENFNSLPWASTGIFVADWYNDSTLPGWHATDVFNLRGSNGSTNATGLFSYGTSDADNGLGARMGLAGSGLNPLHFGVSIVNNTGQ